MPSKDTVKIVDENDFAVNTPERRFVWCIQTPQVFETALIRHAYFKLMENEEIRGLIIGEPNFAGIVGLSNTAFTLRVSFTTLPLKQWTVRFALDSQVKKHFDLAGVRAPVQTYQVLPAPGTPPVAPLPSGEPTL